MVSGRKLTDEQVREIRRSGEPARVLAERYGVSHPTILNVREGNTYSRVADDDDDPVVAGCHNSYFLADAQDFLRKLPDGYCRTVITSPPGAARPSSARRRGTRGENVRRPYREYVDEQHAVIAECIRVAGDRGVVLYHHKPRLVMDRMDMGEDLTKDFPLRKVFIWHYRKQRLPARSKKRGQLTNAYDMIFMFAGERWTLPEESSEDLMGWGDVWEIGLDHESRRFPPWLPNELVDRCIALGTGRVLDPYAGDGAIALGAIRAGRNWLACDTDPEHAAVFEHRRSILEQHDLYFSQLRGFPIIDDDERLGR